MSAEAPPPSAQTVVIDTNIALDLWLFHDPASTALREALHKGSLRALSTQAMQHELARVLSYTAISARLRPPDRDAQAVLRQHARHTQTVEPAPKAVYTCKDPDDQMFIDLAVQHQALLLSKDHHVLSMAKRLARVGVRVMRHWPPAPAPLRPHASTTVT